MKLVTITKQGLITNRAKFATQELAQAWFDENRLIGSFGKIGGWFEESKLTEDQIAASLETATIPNPFPREGEPATFTLHRLADEFTYTITDITLEETAKGRFERGKKRQEFGASIIAQVYGINEEKIAAGTFSNATMQALLTNATLAQIERMLFNGSISTAKVLIQSLDNTFYTAGEKSFIIGLIDDFLTGG